jgi:2-aminoadipate transaminase
MILMDNYATKEIIAPVEVLDSEMNPNHSCYSGNVIYLSTFSKILAPGLRLAWVVAPSEVITKLCQAKQGADLHTATFNQFVAYEINRDGFLDQHVKVIRTCYRERRNAMLDALTEHMPEGVRWTHPQGGLFLWAEMPPKLNSIEIFKDAVANNVAFVPGDSFFPCGGGENTMRLNFSASNPELINEGISRLAQVIKKHLVSK